MEAGSPYVETGCILNLPKTLCPPPPWAGATPGWFCIIYLTTTTTTTTMVRVRTDLEKNQLWYGMVWYGMVWDGMVWYGMVWYGMVWYGMVSRTTKETSLVTVLIINSSLSLLAAALLNYRCALQVDKLKLHLVKQICLLIIRNPKQNKRNPKHK